MNDWIWTLFTRDIPKDELRASRARFVAAAAAVAGTQGALVAAMVGGIAALRWSDAHLRTHLAPAPHRGLVTTLYVLNLPLAVAVGVATFYGVGWLRRAHPDEHVP